MEREKCVYCTNTAKYYCQCKNPHTSFCNEHRDAHERSLGSHLIQLYYQENLLADPRTKEELIKRLTMVKVEANEKIAKLGAELAKTIRELEKQAKNVIRKMNEFINICDEIIVEISSVKEIERKTIYSPLESILISYDPVRFLNHINSPEFVFPDMAKLVLYVPSTFPHSFYNFADLALGSPTENDLQIYSPSKVITNRLYDWFARCLNIGNKRILFTGGANDDETLKNVAYILDLENESISNLPPLNTPRKLHAMTWICGCPAVIGGISNKKPIDSVEIFFGNTWVEIESINIPRSCSTAISTNKASWLIGGVTDIYINSLEKYDGAWKLMNIDLPIISAGIGLICSENSLILLGGQTTESTKIEKTYYVDTMKNTIHEMENLDFPASFASNLILVEKDKVIGLGRGNDKNILATNIEMAKFKVSV